MRRTAVATVAVAWAVTGCSPEPVEPEPLPGEGLRVGFVATGGDTATATALTEGVRTAAADTGVEVVTADVGAEPDPGRQAEGFADLLAEGVDAVLLDPLDPSVLAPVLDRAAEEDVPVITLNRSLETTTAAVLPDVEQAGRVAARGVLGTGVIGEVAVLRGVPDTTASQQVFTGFEETLAERDEVTLIAERAAGYDRDRAAERTTELLDAHPYLVAIFAETDEMALGALDALGDRAGRDVLVLGFGGGDEARAALAEGTLTATVTEQPGELGRAGVRHAVRVLTEDEPAERVLVDHVLVDRENAAAG
ncbi:sugar ABC transporter substrate-binding protein [Actinoalloteichus sp. AHMU CJ021]|uniref:sugar ABC transporter substrate-binding protein n=1 Tax=Actinoalloteichus sp. AHMU CJ021 TaxID=2072503 RepID=UPI0026D4F2D3